MTRPLKEFRPVFVVGVGLHRYQKLSDTPYIDLGLEAIRQALADASIQWESVESSYVATARLGMACGRAMLCHLGAYGQPLVHVENASASGSSAFRLACMEIASGISDIALAVGVDKPISAAKHEETRVAYYNSGIPSLAEDAILPFTRYALLANEYIRRFDLSPDDVARVAVKNHSNGARNPYAHRQTEYSLDEVLSGKRVAGSFTTLQCCPVGEGAAATIIASEDAIRRMNIDAGRVIRVASSAAASEKVSPQGSGGDVSLTRDTVRIALQEAGIAPRQLDLVELHDAFSIEELQYVEAMGLAEDGAAPAMLKNGDFDIGGMCAVNASGGLIAMGHPIGPTGIGQIVEITRQLRKEATGRQHSNAKTGLAHMVGLGAVCYAHVLSK
jgi:acetyl-CoA acetyltransferase